MSSNRIAAISLSLILLALLAWSIFAGVGNLRTMLLLGVGSVLGLLYAAIGQLPDWIIDHAACLTHDDDPSNISPRIYLPILLGVIALAVIAIVSVL